MSEEYGTTPQEDDEAVKQAEKDRLAREQAEKDLATEEAKKKATDPASKN